MMLADLVHELKPRVQRLGLIDPQTGFLDEDEMAIYVQFAIRYLTNRYQLTQFLTVNRNFLTTSAGVESYAIPATFGFIFPWETRRSGLACANTDGTGITNLEYYDPARYNLLRTTVQNKPAWFTMMDNLIYLQPVPDQMYTIEAIEKSATERSEIPEAYAQAVELQALTMMAADQGKNLPLLFAERSEVLRTLVNNEQRQKQRFYTSYERPGFGRGRRRYGL